MDKIEQITAELKEYSDTPALDARLFCEGRSVSDQEVVDFIKRRKAGEPVSKIIGKKGFWKDDFNVTCDVLDPRPDSETLIETILKYEPDTKKTLTFLDIGTGSGCLLLSLLGEYKNAHGVGIDKSDKALQVAQSNTHTDRASFKNVDFMQPYWTQELGNFDIILSNPPYIPLSEIETLDKAVRNYDPLLALSGGIDGLDAYRQLAKTLGALLKPNGKIFFEIGMGQEKDVIALMAEHNFTCLSQQKDLSGIIRVLTFERAI